METSAPTTAKKSLLLPLLGAAVLIAVGVFAYFSFNGKQAAPEVVFTDLQGKTMSTQSLRGKVVMVNFWATSCSSCVKEMPQMADTYRKYNARGLEFVAVAMQYDPPNYVINFAETRQLPFKVALDVQGTLAKSFGDVTLTPTTFVIGKDGAIIKRYVGEPRFDELHQLLEKALAA